MPRKPKAKNTLSAGERVALFEAERENRINRLGECRMTSDDDLTDTPRESASVVLKSALRTEKSKPRPQSATVTVDFSIPTGELKPMHSMCNGPASYGADISSLFTEIGVPFVRFDGTDTAMSAYAVDVSRIFRDPFADPSAAENYDFSVTDRYVEAALCAGTKVIFRLGESFDPLFPDKKCTVFSDRNVLARVCGNIVKHYNDCWAGGFSLGIEYFELWQHAAEGDAHEEFELYALLANSVKLVDENVKVGGLCFDRRDVTAREFVRYCKKNHVPLDFLTVTCFGCDPDRDAVEIERLAAFAQNLGGEIEIVVGRYGYVPGSVLENENLERVLAGRGDKYASMRRRLFELQTTVEGAAYVAAMMLRLSAIPCVRMACFYDAQPMISPWCAICDRFGEPNKPFYAFKAYGELYRAKQSVLCESLQNDSFLHTGVYALAALSEREGYVMLASFGGTSVIDLRLDGIPSSFYSAEVYMLDGVKNLVGGETIPISGIKKRLLLNVSEYGVVLVKLY